MCVWVCEPRPFMRLPTGGHYERKATVTWDRSGFPFANLAQQLCVHGQLHVGVLLAVKLIYGFFRWRQML